MTDSNIPVHQLLKNCLIDANFHQLPNYYRGKVRDTYNLSDGRRIMIATDRQSAFDQVLAAVPHKGQVLNETARFWFKLTEDICANHVIEFPDKNVVVARKLDMMPIEMVVRDYITGSTETSIWTMYERGERILYGHQFQDGLVKNQKLPETIITPTTKAIQGEHDEPVTAREILDRGLVSKEQWKELVTLSIQLFARGREIAAENGLILVDTKYEFGVDEEGRVTLADEIHTPDSSRYWIANSYPQHIAEAREPESLDKEFLRLWIAERCDPYKDPILDIPAETLIEFSGKYIKLYEQITGRVFVPPDSNQPVRARIEESLRGSFPEYFKG